MMENDTMTEDMTEEIWWEDREMSPKAKELTDVLKGMNIRERALAVLDMLAHDADVMQIIRVRMNWEIRNAVFETLNEENRGDITQAMADAIYGQTLFQEVEDVMPVVFEDEFNEHTVELVE